MEKTKKYHNFFKFLVSGGTAALISFSILYVLTDIFGFWYLISSIIAFLIAVIFNFIVQKNWTFKADQARESKNQLILFLVISLINLVINSLGMFFLVEKLRLWYMLAQFFLTGAQAIVNYFVYKGVVFKEKV
ncbi:MAG: hypothetical protein UT48_C0015G0002 [Parcubacteria group bacterium GW2011_GWE2_39_37]|uniref:GtrA/DPMS transmembrane domain-containing protein n=1 Tax=Candidatus Falkowbacteria bacterium GW2011_GWF2_39_8 TaxID=1618642 RepID=A0A0G0PWE2_9BACT|nr:MAG: hypothetical protein UT48_C0015G0002 [Parcubacteria group bacterium GW2011_GWE2_39_37]KKR32223.1 MAG: hypothetical protein UT64_C0039G0002 [Candidatus Falkowbacteria bacterium GW2011_GWF2_39_8]